MMPSSNTPQLVTHPVAELVMALVGLGIGIGLILEDFPWVFGYPLAGVSALILVLLGLRTARRRGAPPDNDS
jgi:hypothetical protein